MDKMEYFKLDSGDKEGMLYTEKNQKVIVVTNILWICDKDSKGS